MCSIAAVGLGLMGVSTVMQIGADRRQAKATRAQGEYEAAVARNNEIIQNRAAEDALVRGEETATETQRRGRQAERIRRQEVSQLIGIQRAALAGSGVEVDTGSALGVTTDTAGIGEEEAREIRFRTDFEVRSIRMSAERAAYQHRIGAFSFAAEADLARARSFTPNTSFATALSGGSAILGNFAVLKKNKVI